MVWKRCALADSMRVNEVWWGSEGTSGSGRVWMWDVGCGMWEVEVEVCMRVDVDVDVDVNVDLNVDIQRRSNQKGISSGAEKTKQKLHEVAICSL